MKKFFFWIFLFLFVYLVLESFAFAGLYFLGRTKQVYYRPFLAERLSENHRRVLNDLLVGKEKYLTYSASLGWTIKPGGSSDLYRANSQGFRSDRETTFIPAPGKLRIAAFGDSFAHGDEVKNPDTWEEKLDTLDPKLETLNFGVPGYGLDQAYLRYKEQGVLFNPHIVIIGFMSDDIHRSVSVFKPFYYPTTGIPLAKPRFALENDKLLFLRNPMSQLEDYKRLLENERLVLRELGEYDFYFRTEYRASPLDLSYLYRFWQILRRQFFERFDAGSVYYGGRYKETSEAFLVTTQLFDAFYEEALKNGSLPLIVIFPNRPDLYRDKKNKVSDYAPLLKYLASKGYRTLNALDGFKKFGEGHSVDDYFNTGGQGGHYGPLGNEVVARFLYDYLKENGLLSFEQN